MTAREIHLVDREARERAVNDLERSLCVEAGAGTGKTSLLVDRFISIVASGRAAAPEIVAITFTEKAAGEMKLRIRRGIERLLADPAPSADERKRLGAAREELERAPISTIHSFAASILREYPVEALVDPGFTQLDALEGSLFFDDCWNDFLLGGGEGRDETIRRFVALGGSIEGLSEMARAVYDRRAERCCGGLFARDAAANAAGPPAGGDADIGTVRGRFLERIERLGALAGGCCTDGEDRGALAIRSFRRAMEPLATLQGEELERFLLSAEIPKPKGNRKNWDPPEACAEQKRIFEELDALRREARIRLSDFLGASLDELFDAFLRFVERRKAAAGSLDFDDLLVRARELCGNPQALDALRARYRFILVDEFQDTDPVQAEIVYLLAGRPGERGDAGPGPGKLFIVGDPKQSIYRFRKADVEIYELVKERLEHGGGDRLSIVQNFRSVPGIVEWVNGTFSEIMQPPPEGRFQPRYEAIAPAREGDCAAVVLFDLEMDAQRPTSGEIRRREGEAVARIIHHLVDSGTPVMDPATRRMEPIAYRHIAVVYPGTTGIDNYEEPLRAEGIPYIIEGGKLYYAREEIRALAAAAWAIEDPYDALALLAALRSPLCGASDEELFLFGRAGGRLEYLDPGADAIAGFPDLDAAFTLLRELHAARNEAGPARTLQELVRRTKFAELSLLRPHGEQRVANIRKAIANARAFEGAAGSYRRFARWFRDQEMLASEESESPLVEEDENAVRLLTVHRAKGLQFPAVILANLVQARRAGPRIIVERGRHLAFKFGESLETGDYARLADGEKLRADAETVRLLYVAATRAGDLLVVPRAPKGGGYFDIVSGNLGLDDDERAEGGGGPDGRSRPESRGPVARWRLSEMPPLRGEERPFARMTEPTKGERDRHAAARDEWIERRLALIERSKRAPAIIAPSRLSIVRALESPAAAQAPATPASAASSGALLFGEAFHRVMERADLSGETPLAPLCSAIAAELGLEDAGPELERLAAAALSSVPVRRAARAAHCFREVPFVLPLGDGCLEGRCDLLFEENGRWTAVDFKTDAAAPEEIEKRLAVYRPQAAAYALALARLGVSPLEGIAFYFVRGDIVRTFEATPAFLAEAEKLVRAAVMGRIA